MNMKSLDAKRIAPLAAAIVVGCSLLAGCNRSSENTTAETPASATTAAPAETAAMTTPPPAAASTAMADANSMPATASTSGEAAAPMADNTSAPPPTSGPISDTEFYQQALSGGEKEIAASKMAEKSSNAKVKELAKTIIADHTALGDKVKAAAGASAPTPATPDTSALDGKTGADLDKAYVDMMVSDHQTDIPMFENAAKNASTDKAKQLASAAVPKLKKHLDLAQKAQAALSK